MLDLSSNHSFNSSQEFLQVIPYKLLKKLIMGEVSGKLVIQNPFDEYVNWQVYFGNGKIHFANSAVGLVERSSYLFTRYLNQSDITVPSQLTDDYQYICNLWRKEILSFQETRFVLIECTKEALIQILCLPKTNCYLDTKERLDQLFLNLDLDQSISPIKHKIRYWWKLRFAINSPFQRPLVEDWDEFEQILTQSHFEEDNLLQKFIFSLKNISCLYKIGELTGISTLQLAIMLHPLVKSGGVTMLSYQDIQEDYRPLVVYIGDRPAEQRVIEITLEKSGFKSLIIGDPFKALAILINQKPNVVIIDSNLFGINGYSGIHLNEV
jgi:twitching motility two-component system response regulator PilG